MAERPLAPSSSDGENGPLSGDGSTAGWKKRTSESVREREREREVQPSGPGQGSVGCSDKVGGPHQEAAPQHEGSGCTRLMRGEVEPPVGPPRAHSLGDEKAIPVAEQVPESDVFNLRGVGGEHQATLAGASCCRSGGLNKLLNGCALD